MVLGRLVKCSRTDLANACSVAAEVAWRTRRVVRRVSKGRGGNMVWFWNFGNLDLIFLLCRKTNNFCLGPSLEVHDIMYTIQSTYM